MNEYNTDICTQSSERELENYTRVTEIIGAFSGIDKRGAEFLRPYAERGTLVHKICEGIIQGFGACGVTEEVEGYIRSFNQWWSDDFEIVESEERFYDDWHMITGQVDLILRIDGKLCLVDLKTSSSAQKHWALQLSAYKNLIELSSAYLIEDSFVVHLSKEGKEPKIRRYEDALSTFMAAYQTYQYFHPKGKSTLEYID